MFYLGVSHFMVRRSAPDDIIHSSLNLLLSDFVIVLLIILFIYFHCTVRFSSIQEEAGAEKGSEVVSLTTKISLCFQQYKHALLS